MNQSNSKASGFAHGEIMTPWGIQKIDDLTPRNPFPKTCVALKHALKHYVQTEPTKSALSPVIAKRIIRQMENKINAQ